MKKLMILLLAACMLTGCKETTVEEKAETEEKTDDTTSQAENKEDAEAEADVETGVDAEAEADMETGADVEAEADVKTEADVEAETDTDTQAVQNITVNFERIYEDNQEYGIFTGVNENNEEVWKFQTDRYEAAQVDRVADIGAAGNIFVYMDGDGLAAVSLADGSALWRADVYGVTDHVFHTNGILYTLGYLTNELCAIDMNGNVLSRTDVGSMTEGSGGLGIKKVEGDKIYIQRDSPDQGEGIFTVYNMNDGSVTVE